jgi:hypothetical protein
MSGDDRVEWGVYDSLFDTLMMLGLLAAGLGLVARSLRAIPDPQQP